MKYSLVIAALLGAMSLNDVQAVELENHHHHHHNKKHQRGQMMSQQEPSAGSISKEDQTMEEQEQHQNEINKAVQDSKAFSKK